MEVKPKILVRTPNWVGDHIMAHPFYNALKSAYSESEIHFICPETLRDFPDQKFCSKKLVFVPQSKRWGPEFLSLVGEIKAEKYDLAINLTASFSSSVLLGACRIPVRVGFSQGGSGLFLTDSLKWKGIKAGRHKSELYMELLDFMTGKHWSVKSSESSIRKCQKRIVVAVGASIPLRVWPYFTELLKHLSIRYPDHELWVVGAKGEQSWHSVLENLKLKNVRDLIEKTSLSELIQVCRDSALVIANDSGVAHIAGTIAQAPTLVLFGPGSPDYIRPIGPNVRCEIPSGVPCHPCESPQCHEKYGYQACLKAIPLESVLVSVAQLLSL